MDAIRRRLITWRDNTDRALINNGTRIDARILIRVMRRACNRVGPVVVILNANHAVLLQEQLIRLNSPYRFGLGDLTVCRGNGHLPAAIY